MFSWLTKPRAAKIHATLDPNTIDVNLDPRRLDVVKQAPLT